jgi:Tfp pilus assembly protein PilO
MGKFYKNLFKRNVFYWLGILILVGLLFFLKTSLGNSVSEIAKKQDLLTARSSSLKSLATLREQFQQANPYFSLLENILPPRDQLLNFSKELESLAKKSELDFGFTFGEEKVSSGKQPGYISFRLTLTGTYNEFDGFLKSVEASRYFVDFSNVDMTKKGDTFSVIVNGKVFFR